MNADAGAVLVTGAGVRLGRVIALGLAEAGWDVAVHYNRSAGPAEETVSAIRGHGRQAFAFAADLSRPDEVEALVGRVVERLPNLRALVNSASVYDQGTVRETTAELFDRQMAVNLRAPMLLLKSFAAAVERGAVVNILDNKIAFHQYQYGAYLLSKKGLADLTRMAAMELAPALRVNGVAPGVVLPASIRSEAYLEWRRQGIPLGVQGDPREIARAVNYLLDADFVTGQILFVDGGESVAAVGRNAGAWDDDGGA